MMNFFRGLLSKIPGLGRLASKAEPLMDEATAAARIRAARVGAFEARTAKLNAEAEAIRRSTGAGRFTSAVRGTTEAVKAAGTPAAIVGTGYLVVRDRQQEREARAKNSTGNPLLDNIADKTGLKFGAGSLLLGLAGAVAGIFIGGPLIGVLLGVVGAIGGQPLMNALGLFKKDEAASQQAGAAGTQQAEGHTTEEQRTAGQTEEIGQLSPGSTPTPTPAQQQTGQQQPQSQHTR